MIYRVVNHTDTFNTTDAIELETHDMKEALEYLSRRFNEVAAEGWWPTFTIVSFDEGETIDD